MTTVFSLFAYIWLVIILIVNTPQVVDVWEAVLTFLFFPALVIMAYATDQSCFRRRPPTLDESKPGEEQNLNEANANKGFGKKEYLNIDTNRPVFLFFVHVLVS